MPLTHITEVHCFVHGGDYAISFDDVQAIVIETPLTLPPLNVTIKTKDGYGEYVLVEAYQRSGDNYDAISKIAETNAHAIKFCEEFNIVPRPMNEC